MSQAVVTMKLIVINVSAWSHDEMINCLKEVQEQLPASYKQSKIQQGRGRELCLTDI